MKFIPRFIGTALLSFALAATCALAATPSETFQSKEKLGTWLAHFYEAPDPANAPAAVLAASKLGMYQGGVRSFAYMGFITGLMSKYPDQAANLAKEMAALPAEDQPSVIVGVWYSTAPTKKEILKSLAELMPTHKDTILYLAQNDSQPVFTLPMEDGNWVLDIVWGHYFATGDLRSISRVIDALQFANDPAKNKAAAADQAQFSLTIQGKLHPSVLAAVRAEMSKRDAKTRVLLAQVEKDILTKAPSQK